MRENTVNPRVNRDKNGFESVFGKFSDSNKRNTIIDSITVVTNEIRSPESHVTIRLIIIS